MEPLVSWISEYTQVGYALERSGGMLYVLLMFMRKASATHDVSNLDFKTWSAVTMCLSEVYGMV